MGYKAGAGIATHPKHWCLNVATAFSLAHHYWAVLGWQNQSFIPLKNFAKLGQERYSQKHRKNDSSSF